MAGSPLHLPIRSDPRNFSASGKRDERIDFLRGLAMLAIIVNHTELRSLYQIFSVEAVGAVSGAESFVLLSGVVLGLIGRQRIERDDWRATVFRSLKRAGQLYLVALVTNLFVFCLQFQHVIDATILTTYADSKADTVYNLYGNSPSTLEFIRGMLLLTYGPGQINILGLYVVLVALLPALLWLLHSGRVYMLLALSWCLYFVNSVHPFHALPSQSENSFSLLSWQLLFVHGVVIGYYRHQFANFLRKPTGKTLTVIATAAFFVFCFYALNNPWYDIPGPTRFHCIPETIYGPIYKNFFLRRGLGLGRFFDILVVTLVFYRLLTRHWVILRRALGWLCIPIGQASLYVFVVHLLFVLVAANVNLLHKNHVLLNTLAHTLIIGLIWLMVRARFLFWLIPR